MSLAQQQQLDADYLMQTYKRKPVEFVRGEGIRLYDSAGSEYLDFLAGVGAVSVGHANPRLTAALKQQAEKLIHVGNYYYVGGRGELAQKISDLLSRQVPEVEASSWRSFFCNSGAEAVEGAIKIARKYGNCHLDGASTIIYANRSFHGRTLAALAATGQASKREAFAPMPQGFVAVDLNDIPALREALHHGSGGGAVCAVLLECIQGEGGVYPCSEEYLQAARRLTEELGILLILDEVQTGFYRTGNFPFAFQQYGITPDVVTLAKGLGGGMPIGAVAARGEAAGIFEPGDHGSTFGGSPLAIAAANAVLGELEETHAGVHVAETGLYLQERLAQLPFVSEVRGRGLMVGIELDGLAFERAEQMVNAGLEAGLVLNSIGSNILRFLPPLVCTRDDIDLLIERLQRVFEIVTK